MISEIRITLEGVDSNNETVLSYGLDAFLTKAQYKRILVNAAKYFEADSKFFGDVSKVIKNKANDAA